MAGGGRVGWLLGGLVACGDPAPADPEAGSPSASPVEAAEAAASPDLPTPDEDLAFVPRGGARLFVRGRPEVTVTTVRSGGVTEAHRAMIGAGVFYTSNVATLAEAQGVLEVSLTSWTSDDPVRDGIVRRQFFEVDVFPVAYIEVHGLDPFELPLAPDAAATTRARGVVVVGTVERPLDVGVEVKRVDDGYRFTTTESLALSIDQLERPKQRSATLVACSDACKFADEVLVAAQFEITWNYGMNTPREPGRMPKAVAHITGDDTVSIDRPEPPPFLLEDNGRYIWEEGVRRDILKDPRPEDVRMGRIKIGAPKGTPDDAKDDPPIELWTK